MPAVDATVFLIDDDADVREAVSRLLRSAGWKATAFASAQQFMESQACHGIGCIVLDICMPDMSGPALHTWMRQQGILWPVIYLSGKCDVPTSVQAMKSGALDVLQKPVDADQLLDAIARGVAWHEQECLRRNTHEEIWLHLNTLSAREREVMDQVTLGRLNKQIAADLGIAEKTVKVHRGRAMAKMKVRSVAELVHLCDQLGIQMTPADHHRSFAAVPCALAGNPHHHRPAASGARLDQGPI